VRRADAAAAPAADPSSPKGGPRSTQRGGQIQGCVFHIIHGSFVDGHGIRTTVFLKGCPLRCLWCCNPEGQQPYSELKVTIDKCNQCGNCTSVCESGAISLDRSPKESSAGSRPVAVDRGLCTNCGACVEVCHTGALDFFGEIMTVEEVYKVVAKDLEYYRASGGGVTIGGGEPTVQADFTYALMRRCQQAGIHVAIDTCGHTHTAKGLKILDEADLLLFDLKGMEPEGHGRNTGVTNELILQNLVRRGERGGPMIIRMPLVPGCNDSRESVVRIAELLSRYESVERVDLMPYHKFGTVKYEQLSREYGLGAVDSPSQEQINAVTEILDSYGCKTQTGG
jgi:pyruvate formate lyase activating enzyme